MFKNLPSFFREETMIGLDIGEDYIAAVQLSSKKKGYKIKNLGCVDREPNLSDRDIASAVKKLWRQYYIASQTVCSCLHSPSLVLKHFKYPRLSTEELESTLYLEAEQTFQKPPKELFIDWYLYPVKSSASNGVDSTRSEVSKTREGILVVVPQEDVKRHLTILKLAGLYPIALDIGCMAISNLFLKFRALSRDKVICLINIGSHSADMAILSDGSKIYPRSFYSQSAPWQERKDYLIENIKDVLKYYQFKLHRSAVSKLFLTGKVCFDTQFQSELKKAIDLPVEFWNPLREVGLKNNLSDEEINNYGPLLAVSLGLALRR